MERLTIAVIFGGVSPEHSVSLQSAHAVITNLDPGFYNVVALGIDESGRWFRYYGDAQKIKDGAWAYDAPNCIPVLFSPDRETHGVIELFAHGAETTRLDAAFPVLHGENGEDGTVQGLVELAGIPLIGCGTLASALAMDKRRTNLLLEQSGIRSPRFEFASASEPEAQIAQKAESVGYPLFVKPSRTGSSLGISKVESPAELADAVQKAFLFDNELLIEQAVDGFEVGCAVMGNDVLTIGEVDEIELQGGFFDFYEKYNLDSSTIHLPARIDISLKTRIKQTASSVYRALGCRVFARVDLFVTAGGDILFNEVNTIPGFTAHSRFPNMMKGIGLSYSEILDRLVALGLEHATIKNAVEIG